MKKFLIILALALLCIPMCAHAQTVTKAPAIPGYTGGNGFFFGLGAEGSGTSITNAPAGTTAIGGDLEAVVGYGFTVSAIPMFVDASIGFQNLNAGSAGFLLSGPAHAMERFAVQAPIAQLLPIIGINPQSVSIPVLPPGVVVNGTAQSYWFAGATEDDVSASAGVATAHEWLVGAITGPGILVPVKVGTNWNAVVDVWAGVTLTSSGLCIGTAPASLCPALGTGARGGVRILF